MKWTQRIASAILIFGTTFIYLISKMIIRRGNISQDSVAFSNCSPATEQEEGPPIINTGTFLVPMLPWKQFGPGANGSEVKVDEDRMSSLERLQYYDDYLYDDFNGFLSDVISVHRTLRDYRPEICRNLTYPDKLPSVGIVIPFKDEHLSILLRTVYSVLYNTPGHLLAEIVLVDDGSIKSELKTMLDIHVANLPKVSVIRLQTSLGLMMARQAGIDILKAEYFVCMDCHMEVFPGWIEPLLSRLLEEPNALLCSNVGSIDQHTFRPHHAEIWQIQDFFPFLLFNLDTTSARYKKSFVQSRRSVTDPLPIGIIQGMMIVMRRSWFQQLGGFDPGMKIWGSEQMELSIKVWTCGGRVEMIPCSYAVHMFRRNMWKMKNERVANTLRVAEVWLDEHKYKIHEYYYNRKKEIDVGDVSDRIRIRRQNQCKPFNFYLESIRQFADFEFSEIRHKGGVKNFETGLCLDPLSSKKGLSQYPCHFDGIQFFELTKLGKLRILEHCLVPKENNTVTFKFCTWGIPPDSSEPIWDYTEDLQLKHVRTGYCLTAVENENIGLEPCQLANQRQQWTWTVMT